MAFLQRLFFESPIYLGIASFLLFGLALLVRRARRETLGRWIAPATVGLIVLLFVLQSFVVTQREHILAATDQFIAAVENRNISALRAIISESYESEGMDAAAIIAYIDDALERLSIYDTRTHRRDVTVDRNRAEMLLAARATVRIGGDVGQMHWGSWRLGWSRDRDAWRITSIRPIMIDGIEFRSLGELRGQIP